MIKLIFSGMLLLSLSTEAQELFSMTEPASNMPSGSFAIRVDNSIMDEINSVKTNYHLIPGIRVGLTKKLMLEGNIFFSNRSSRLSREGASLYAKYRFLSNDAIQRHFRMGLFARISSNNSDIHQEEINMYGHNTGFEAGIVATKLLYKVAFSSAISTSKAFDNGNQNKFVYGKRNSSAINYSLSVGKLMLPKEYSNYRQTNVNLMVETSTQVNCGSGKYYLDIAPTLQFIFNSQSRIDLGFKKELGSTLVRTAPNGFFIRLEHIFFDSL